MAFIFQRVGTASPLQKITKLCIQSKIPCNFNKLGGCLYSGSTKDSAEDGPTLYDCRKISHDLPTNSVCPPFEILHHMPSGVFRETQGEVLGIGAAKRSCYPNPEYFAYHQMSFYDFHLHISQYRLPCPDTKRKPLS